MCGFLFALQRKPIVTNEAFEAALDSQSWRGPDSKRTIEYNDDGVLIGHNRLSIVDPFARSNQPMQTQCGRYTIAYNGEIYNQNEIRKQLQLPCQTTSDTEVILLGYQKLGAKITELLQGMFAFVIYDKFKKEWFAARDRFGIKPLYIFETDDCTVMGSEPGVIARLLKLDIDQESIAEWQIARRPMPGFSFFKGLKEFPIAHFHQGSQRNPERYYQLTQSESTYCQEEFEELLKQSIVAHEMSDVSNVSLLSGGMDSAVVAQLSSVHRAYTIGSRENNEFAGAQDSAAVADIDLRQIIADSDGVEDTWRHLIKLRGEPLSVPNEGLIYNVCKAMEPKEKVVLTGEGADELLFGYDGIFRWSLADQWQGAASFLRRYGYSEDVAPTERFIEYIVRLKAGKTTNEFVEDFFWDFHLPGLLRRMDFASMAASKEARVPFVYSSLADYLYRRPAALKISATESKIPLRKYCERLGLHGAIERKKIGFSATFGGVNKINEYKYFQKLNLEVLEW
ncbi:asparagine synthase (glutamine-hydrolyzing) [Thalassorhabdomicrobium marinisediminis]|uniref:asparagine synthase (glutamine-hydrolyzing) n=1 Tax=Thalassorhabdomicrobium marinisediminis TaxID=2170577 RepID=A0A2T7FWF1_9RHOB|nr:asparagine synthase (glutamine-hydrolyzing) [Thalassorhabdomicrobium marinisediminis]PVA06482.1 asparagine synthase (glutamine-hydrolyzing) [Thalassorhabdomicrobium marinisediminis]